MSANGLMAYRKTQVQTAHPVQLIVQLYEEGAIRFTENAVASLQRGDLESAHNAFVRAQEVVSELRATLKLDTGPLALSLNELYDLMYRKLVVANIGKEIGPARDVLGYLRELLPVWKTIAQQAVNGNPIVDLAPATAVGATGAVHQ